jgi:hypothetical protein
MKRVALLFLIASGLVPAAFAQETGNLQVGVYADYFRLSQTKSNFAGLGARVGIPVFRNVSLEGEMNYDYDQAFTERFTDTTGVLILQRSGIRLLHGMIGPKIMLGGRHGLSPFITVKGGFMDVFFDQRPATIGTFISSVGNLRGSNLSGVFYPGGGLEGRLGPVGLRMDIGDEMYFNKGTHNNLRIAFGPFIRF